jgi:hypothetical protein
MKVVYISGPLTGVRNIDNLRNFYENVGAIVSLLGAKPYIPHQHSDPIKHPNISPRKVYLLDRKNVCNADLVIAYVGIPSIGVGQEIEIANRYCKPVVLLYETNRTVSRMVRGNPSVMAEVVGPDWRGILSNLEEIIQELLFTEIEVFIPI